MADGRPGGAGTRGRPRRRFQRHLRSRRHEALGGGRGDLPGGRRCPRPVASEYLVSALPVSYFVNAEGRVVGAPLGPQTVSSLQRWIARLEVADDGATRSGGEAAGPAIRRVGISRPSPAPPVDRAAALAEGAPGIPPNFVFWVLGFALVASLGGLLAEHVFSSAGLNPVPDHGPAAPRLAPTPQRTDTRRPIAPSKPRWRRSWA